MASPTHAEYLEYVQKATDSNRSLDREDEVHEVASLAHISSDFLLWLWFRADTEKAEPFSLSDIDLDDTPDADEGMSSVTIHSIDKISLRWPYQTKVITVVRSEADTAPEAFASLASGKLVEEISMLFTVDEDQQFEVTLGGPNLDIKGAKLPMTMADTTESQLMERMFLFETLERVIATLFLRFAIERTHDYKHRVGHQIYNWLDSNLRSPGQTE